jgi:hypothetical protein
MSSLPRGRMNEERVWLVIVMIISMCIKKCIITMENIYLSVFPTDRHLVSMLYQVLDFSRLQIY